MATRKDYFETPLPYGETVAKKMYSFLHPQARRVKTELTEDSITQSEFAKESDINYLVEKHVRANIPFPQHSIDQYRDVSELGDFQAAQEIVTKAREAWYSLPAQVRRHFGDRPENFLGALEDPERHDELVRLNVLKRQEPAQNPVGSSASTGSQGDPKPKAKGGSETQGT